MRQRFAYIPPTAKVDTKAKTLNANTEDGHRLNVPKTNTIPVKKQLINELVKSNLAEAMENRITDHEQYTIKHT